MPNRSFSLLSPRLERYFDDYSSYHRTPGNKLTHYFGIFFIVTSLLGLLGNIPIPLFTFDYFYLRLDCGTLLLALALLQYIYLDWKIALPFGLVLTGLYFLGRSLPLNLNLSLFVLGWILQGIGHAIFEKNSPAFFKNFTHLFIGPLWIFARLVNYK